MAFWWVSELIVEDLVFWLIHDWMKYTILTVSDKLCAAQVSTRIRLEDS